MTLTCGNAALVVVSLGEGMDFRNGLPATDQGSKPEIFRFLYTEERLRCHGFPVNADYGLSARQSIKASGNAYSVNTVGRILAPYLKALIDTDALTEVPLVKPAGVSPKGQTNLKGWLKKNAPDPWTEMSKENFDDESRFDRWIERIPGPLKKKSGSFYGLDDELLKELEAWSEESEDIGNCAHDDDETEEEMEQSAAASAGPSTLRRKYTDAYMDATVLESESASEAEPPTTKPKK